MIKIFKKKNLKYKGEKTTNIKKRQVYLKNASYDDSTLFLCRKKKKDV